MELVVEDGVFVTMAADAGAMLIRDGRIAAIGQAEAVRAAAPGAAVVRLGGATVVPGLIDAHCHVADVGYLAAAADCSQPSAPEIATIQARLREAADRTPEGSWVTGSGYAEYKLREGRHPTRAELDQAVPGRPAVLYHTSLHACVLNTAALRRPGSPTGSRILRAARSAATVSRLDDVVTRHQCRLFERTCAVTSPGWARARAPDSSEGGSAAAALGLAGPAMPICAAIPSAPHQGRRGRPARPADLPASRA